MQSAAFGRKFHALYTPNCPCYPTSASMQLRRRIFVIYLGAGENAEPTDSVS
jgi:hypothetical protein